MPNTIHIYGPIGDDTYYGDITPASIVDQLTQVDPSLPLDVHINSPGGFCFEGFTIYNLLKGHPATVHVYVDGLAASIASVIAMAGDKIIMSEAALLMIHNPSGFAIGESADMRKAAGTLDKVRDQIVTVYAGRTGKSVADIIEMMDNETWLDADEAIEAGFADEATQPMKIAACASPRFKYLEKAPRDLSQFIRIGDDMPRKPKNQAEEVVEEVTEEEATETTAAEGDVQPETTITPTPTPETAPPSDATRAEVTAELARYTATFGPEAGVKFFQAGTSFVDALQAHLVTVQAENTALQTKIGQMVAVTGEPEPVDAAVDGMGADGTKPLASHFRVSK